MSTWREPRALSPPRLSNYVTLHTHLQSRLADRRRTLLSEARASGVLRNKQIEDVTKPENGDEFYKDILEPIRRQYVSHHAEGDEYWGTFMGHWRETSDGDLPIIHKMVHNNKLTNKHNDELVREYVAHQNHVPYRAIDKSEFRGRTIPMK